MRNSEQENYFQWLVTSRLFERYFFFYFLIMLGIGAIGAATLGFKITGVSAQLNIVANIVWVFVLTFAMWHTPLWFRILLGRRTDVLKDTESIYQQLDELDTDSLVLAKKQLTHDGKLPPSKLQFAAMVFIGWYFVFEFCIVTSFVDTNHQLIWEPQWLQSLIEWGIDNTRTPAELPPTKGGENTLFYASFRILDFLKEYPFSGMQFSSERAFLHSPLGHTAMFFSLWRLFTIIPVLIAFWIVLSKMLGWLGLNGLNVYYSKGIVDFFGKVLFTILTSIFLLMIGMLKSLNVTSESMMKAEWWIGNFPLHCAIYVFPLMSLILITGWFKFLFRFFVLVKDKFSNT